jgi:hypothetical protein
MPDWKMVDMTKEEFKAIIIEEMISLYTEEGNAVNIPTKMIEKGVRMSIPGWEIVAERLSSRLEDKLLQITE